MDRTGYRISLNFSNFRDVEIEEREINGKMEQVCVIPMRLNGIKVSKAIGKRGIMLFAKMMPAKPNPYKQSHYLIVNPSAAAKEERKQLGLHPLIIIGNAAYIFAAERYVQPLTTRKLNRITNLPD